jgi:hypothetical protein
MMVDLAGKRVLVLSDNDRLSRAIELNLNHRMEVKVLRSVASPPVQDRSQAEVADFDLIVVAMISPTSEPVVALARASLAGRIGQVPLLIISERPFDLDPYVPIVHLDFPFNAHALHDRVQELLQGGS